MGFSAHNRKISSLDEQNDNTDQTFPDIGISGQKIRELVFDKIITGTLRVNESLQSKDYVPLTSGWKIWDVDGVGYIEAQNIIAGNYIQVFRQDAIPTSIHIGDLWVKTNAGNKLYVALSVGADQITAGEWVDASDEAIATAQAAAEAAQSDADTALAELDDVADDAKITPVEKLTVKPIWDAVVLEKSNIDTQADTYSVSKVAYGTAYTNLNTYLNTTITVFADMTATTDITRATWDGYWEAYYDAKVEILQAIADATALLAAWDGVTGTGKPEDNADVSPNFPSDENLVGYWSLDEGSGSKAYDGSGNSNDGTLVNMEEADWVDGVVGKCLELDGVDDKITISNDSSLEVEQFTISAWIKPSSDYDFTTYATTWRGIFTNGALNAREFGLNWQSNKTNPPATVINIDIMFTGAGRVTTNGTLTLDTWNHIVATWKSGEKVKLYKNGILVTESGSAYTDTIIYGTDDCIIGHNGSDRYFPGKIDEVRIYKTALTAKEVSALYKYPAGNKGVVIPGTQIIDETITADKIVDATITATQIANLTITAGQIANATITTGKIVSLNIDKLNAGTITSKAITLAVSAGNGDAKIQAGKTDFNNDANGFILGLDDSDGDKAKLYLGSTTKYLNWTGTDLNVVGGVITGGTIQTSASGERVILTDGNGVRVYDTNSKKRIQLYNGQLNFYDTAETWCGRIIGDLVGTDSVVSMWADYFGPNSNNGCSLGYSGRLWSDVWGTNGWFTYIKQAYSVNHDPHTAPGTMAEGDVYYDSGLNKLRVNVGGANWETIQSS